MIPLEVVRSATRIVKIGTDHQAHHDRRANKTDRKLDDEERADATNRAAILTISGSPRCRNDREWDGIP